MADRMSSPKSAGSAVLVHGLGGNPDDWRWVKDRLHDAHVLVKVVDLPSHQIVGAGRAEDAHAVRQAIRSSATPVVVAGWSYGGSVISMAATGESVAQLVYLSHLPQQSSTTRADASWITEDPWCLTAPDGRFIVDNDRLLREVGPSFPPEVLDHLRRRPRRWASTKVFDPQTGAAWHTTRSVVLLGRSDPDYPADEVQQWATEHPGLLRLLDSDHFIIFRQPAMVADAVTAALREFRSTSEPFGLNPFAAEV